MGNSVLRFDQGWLNSLVDSMVVDKSISDSIGILVLNFHHRSWLNLFILISNLWTAERRRSLAVGVEVRIEAVFDY